QERLALRSFPTRRSSDLEWATHSENGLHAYETNLRVSQKGEVHGRSRLTEKEVLSIYFLAHTGKFEQKKIAEMFNIHLATVSDIKLKKRWKHRSEEHTSELQSRFDLVCRLLLE